MYKDSVAACETVCDIKAELPIETEILIPDYLPQIFKIVKCFARLVVLQKQISSSRITIEGYLRCVVYYQSDTNQSLCQVEQKLPFTKQADLREGNYFGWDSFVTGETEYINCRAVNQRRIDIRGAFALGVKVFARTQQEIITALADEGIEQKLATLTGMRTVGSQEKLITAEDNIVFDAPPTAVIDTALRFSVNETKLMSGKAVIKGELIAEITYRTDDTSNVSKAIKSVPFNEILDIDGAAEDCTAYVTAEPTGCTILTGGENGEVSLSITAQLNARVTKPCEYLAVSDAFSTSYQTAVEKTDITMEQIEDVFTQQVQVQVEGTLPDENVQIIDVRATALPIEAIEENQQVQLRSRVSVHIICLNALGELDCYDKTAEYTLPKRYNVPIENIMATCSSFVNSVNVRKAGAEALANVNITAYGMITSKNKKPVVSAVSYQDELKKQDDDVALRIYYAQAGEDVFDIAKRYWASPLAISCANQIEQDILTSSMQLLIPSAL